MEKIMTLIAVLLSWFSALAQPIITENNMPQIGDQTPVIYCTDVPVESTLDAQTGMNYNWDFSGLTTESTQGFDFVDPSGTLWGNAFTSADICGVDLATDAHAYYTSTNAALSNSGYRLILGPGDTLAVNYTDQEQIIDFPFTFNHNHTDAFSGYGSAGGFPVTMAGNITYTADGYGTLQLPSATYNNVIRYRMDRSEVTSFNGTPTGTVVKDQWVWISTDYKYWLLLMELVDDGFGVDDNVWYQSSPLPALTTGIEESAADEIQIYPNPVSTGATFRIGKALTDEESLELYDSQGRLMLVVTSASNIDLNGVGSGMYLVKINNSKGNTISTQRLIVQ